MILHAETFVRECVKISPPMSDAQTYDDDIGLAFSPLIAINTRQQVVSLTGMMSDFALYTSSTTKQKHEDRQ